MAVIQEKKGCPTPYLTFLTAYLLLPAVLAVVSIALIGYTYGTSNNVFHIPYVLRLAESPEFSNDAFYASLKYFTSAVWPALRLITSESNIQDNFFLAHFISRASAFAGIVFLARACGLRDSLSLLLCMTGTVLTPFLQGHSAVGDHGMFIGYFSHSEVTWPFIFLSLALASQNKLVPALAATGITFSINAFIGIWLLLANTAAIAISNRPIRGATILKSGGTFILFSFPIAIWIAATVSSTEQVVNFSFREYIREYYPPHFLIEGVSWKALVEFLLISTIGLISSQKMPNKKFWINIQLVCIAIFLIGIPLPYLVDSRFIFNLHLLRSTGLEQAIAITLSLFAGTKLALDSKNNQGSRLGVISLLSISAIGGSVGLLIAILSLGTAISLEQENKPTYPKKLKALISQYAHILILVWVGLFFLGLIKQIMDEKTGLTQSYLIVFLAASVIALPFSNTMSKDTWHRLLVGVSLLSTVLFIAQKAADNQSDRAKNMSLTEEDKSWAELVSWVRISDIHGEFLVPVKDQHSKTFQLLARRKIWVDLKQGAAVMWDPSFYYQWMPRYKEVLTLDTPEKFIAYGQKKSIKNIVIATQTAQCPSPSVSQKKTAYFVLCQLP